MSPEQEKKMSVVVARVCARTADISEAAEQIRQRLAKDAALYNALIEELIGTAIRQYIYRCQHSQRATVRVGMAVGAEPETEIQRRNQIFAQTMLDSWPVGSRRLGDCDGPTLEDAANTEEATAKGHLAVAAFYRKIARRVKGSAVRDVLTNEQVATMYRQCTK